LNRKTDLWNYISLYGFRQKNRLARARKLALASRSSSASTS